MKFDTIEILDDQTIKNMAVESGTEAERLAKTGMNGGELFNQTDGTTGMYTYSGGWVVSTSIINVSLSGIPTSVGTSSISTLDITNYSFQSVYSVAVVGGGGATIVDSSITYTSRSTQGTDVLTVTQDGNDTTFNIPVAVTLTNHFSTLGDGGADNQSITYSCIDSSKNVYTTGLDFTGTTTAVNMKFDANGDIVWQRKYPGPSSQENICCDDTAAYVVGYSSNVTFVNKIDGSTGDIVWEISYTGTYRGTAITENGTDLYVCGPNNGIQMMKLSKLDGSVIWNKDYDAAGNASETNGIAYYNGFIYGIAKWSNSAVLARITKIDASNGTVSWTKDLAHSSSNQTVFEGVSVDSTGVYCCGWVRDASGPNHNLIVKYDSTGNRIWYKTYRDLTAINNSIARYYDVTVTGTHVYAAGTTFGVNGANGIGVPMYSKFDIDGVHLYHNALDLASGKRGLYKSVIIDDSNIILAGSVQPTGAFNHDGALIYNDDDGVSLIGVPTNHTDMTFVTPAGVSDTSGSNTFTDSTPVITALNISLTLVPTALSNGAGTLTATKSLY